MHLPEAVPGQPSWQLLTSAANPGKLPARDRDERQRKSETGLKVGGPGPQPPASPSCAPISFFSKPSQPRRLMSGHGAAGASGREPLLLCSKSRGRAVRRAQPPPAPRLQVSPSLWGGRHHSGLDSGPTLAGPMWAAGKAEEGGISASLRAQARSIIPHCSPVISASRHLGCVSHFTEEDTEVIATE